MGKSFEFEDTCMSGNIALLKRLNSATALILSHMELKLSLIRHNNGSPLHAPCSRPHQYLMSLVGRRVECEYHMEYHAVWMVDELLKRFLQPVTVHPQGEIPRQANTVCIPNHESSHEQTRLKPCRGVYIQDITGTKAVSTKAETMVWEQFHPQKIKVRFVHGQHSEILRCILSRVTEGVSSSSYL
ncbi:hypothetical protein K439DRAFT_1634884 [Ramaria rubella]|nr:hypothetical protein K439DRAFT_1634884 [Ramaria rubella]